VTEATAVEGLDTSRFELFLRIAAAGYKLTLQKLFNIRGSKATAK
jgi:hypothetical protein